MQRLPFVANVCSTLQTSCISSYVFVISGLNGWISCNLCTCLLSWLSIFVWISNYRLLRNFPHCLVSSVLIRAKVVQPFEIYVSRIGERVGKISLITAESSYTRGWWSRCCDPVASELLQQLWSHSLPIFIQAKTLDTTYSLRLPWIQLLTHNFPAVIPIYIKVDRRSNPIPDVALHKRSPAHGEQTFYYCPPSPTTEKKGNRST